MIGTGRIEDWLVSTTLRSTKVDFVGKGVDSDLIQSTPQSLQTSWTALQQTDKAIKNNFLVTTRH